MRRLVVLDASLFGGCVRRLVVLVAINCLVVVVRRPVVFVASLFGGCVSVGRLIYCTIYIRVGRFFNIELLMLDQDTIYQFKNIFILFFYFFNSCNYNRVRRRRKQLKSVLLLFFSTLRFLAFYSFKNPK